VPPPGCRGHTIYVDADAIARVSFSDAPYYYAVNSFVFASLVYRSRACLYKSAAQGRLAPAQVVSRAGALGGVRLNSEKYAGTICAGAMRPCAAFLEERARQLYGRDVVMQMFTA
jgi:hypothetical protein